jgi:hypothetical protein
MARTAQSDVWQTILERGHLADGVYPLDVNVTNGKGGTAEDTIRLVLGASTYRSPQRSKRDQDNAVEAWPERGLLGHNSAPTRMGRKW